MTLTDGQLSAGNCPCDTLCKTNSTGTDLFLNPGNHDAKSKQANSCLASLMLLVFYGAKFFIKMFIFLAT
jgi:hypothetical protein